MIILAKKAVNRSRAAVRARQNCHGVETDVSRKASWKPCGFHMGGPDGAHFGPWGVTACAGMCASSGAAPQCEPRTGAFVNAAAFRFLRVTPCR